jgi:hypothetical protein
MSVRLVLAGFILAALFSSGCCWCHWHHRHCCSPLHMSDELQSAAPTPQK